MRSNHAAISIKPSQLPCFSGDGCGAYITAAARLHFSWDLFKTYPGCPLLPPSSGSLCVPPSEGAHNCSYDGSSGNTYQLETSLVINCCCGQCDTDLTCSPDSASGYGFWQTTHTSLCPENGCGTQGEYAATAFRPSSTCFCHAFFYRCCSLNKFPWRLSEQPGQNGNNTSGVRASDAVDIHCVQLGLHLFFLLRLPDNQVISQNSVLLPVLTFCFASCPDNF